MGASAAVLAFVEREMLACLRLLNLAHDRFRCVEQRRPQIHAHCSVRPQEVDVRFLGSAAVEPLQRQRVEPQLQRVLFRAHRRRGHADAIGLVINQHGFGALFEP